MQTIGLFGPVRADLDLVEARLRDVSVVDYPLLADLLAHTLQPGGKRVRPALTLLAGRLFHYDLDVLVPMAAAVELLHTATLVHDDTVDNAGTRRGQPTVNTVWNNGIAVLVGDYLFAQSAVLTASTKSVRVMTIFAETLMLICKGQVREVFAYRDAGQTLEDYYARIEGKTASLLAMACQVGAILGGAPEETIEALYEYGHRLGMAFQIVDDILDFTGDERELGKPIGNDLRQGTITLPAILLLEQQPLDNPIRDLIETGPDATTVERAVELVNSSGVIDQSYAVAHEYAVGAREALERAPAGEARDALLHLVDYVIERRH